MKQARADILSNVDFLLPILLCVVSRCASRLLNDHSFPLNLGLASAEARIPFAFVVAIVVPIHDWIAFVFLSWLHNRPASPFSTAQSVEVLQR